MAAGALAVRVRAPSLSLSVADCSGWEAGGAIGRRARRYIGKVSVKYAACRGVSSFMGGEFAA